MSSPLSVSTRAPESFDKDKTKTKILLLKDEISELQKVLYAESKHSLLLILQGIDASGKDGLIANVFSGLNPLGCSVSAFKVPTLEEDAHDFLWRIHKNTPAKGMIGIFNRSHYESLLVPVVEGEIDQKEINSRIKDINNFEDLLKNNNTIVLKFYLHISKKEQEERLMERQTNPKKFWKHNDSDWSVSHKWDRYMAAYENIFKNCNSPEWHVIPSDQNWYKEYLVAEKVLETLKSLNLKYPGKLLGSL